MRTMRPARIVAAILIAVLCVVPLAAAHPGHGLEGGTAHELYHIVQVAVVIGAALALAAVPGFIASRLR
jgi:hypothetical protein